MKNKKNDKNKLVCTKEMLIKDIATECNITQRFVKQIYSALESHITDYLLKANGNTDVSIRIFEGMTIDSTFTPERLKLNNLTGEQMIVKSRIKPKVHITKNYCEKINLI